MRQQRPELTIETEDFHRHLRADIEKGRFVPFLGAGASSLRTGSPVDPQGLPWGLVGARVDAIRSNIGDADSTHGDSPDIRFLDGLLRSYRLKASVGSLKQDVPDGLLEFQVGLLRFVSHLTGLFGAGMSVERVCARDPAEISVGVGHDPQVGELAVRLTRASAELAAVPAEGMPAALVPRTMVHEKLLYLVDTVIGPSMPPADALAWKAAHEEPLRRVKKNLARRGGLQSGRLRLDTLTWLSELFWFTLRYRVPAYPTTAELAFAIALQIPEVGPRTGELAQAAELRDNKAALTLGIRDWLKFCEAGRRADAFHVAIASALRMQQEYVPPDEPSAPAYRGKTLRLRGLAFTTNYDTALERAFTQLGVPYHVVLPVLRRERSAEEAVAGSRTAEGWVMKSWIPNIWKEDVDASSHPPAQDINGPIVVKLHGSPLHDIGDASHRIIISESDYLEAIGGRSALDMPAWIWRELGAQERALWFLGYSLGDWNIRLRLYRQVRSCGSDEAQERVEFQQRSRAVNHQADLLRFAVLGSLGVHVCESDLRELADTINEAIGKRGQGVPA